MFGNVDAAFADAPSSLSLLNAGPEKSSHKSPASAKRHAAYPVAVIGASII
jgi:hypothetical protein